MRIWLTTLLTYLSFNNTPLLAVTHNDSFFNNYNYIAKNYNKGRPDYPPEATSILISALELKPNLCVLDLAAGTGKLTKALKHIGTNLCAVEPAAEMRAIFSEQFPEIPIFDGRAEAIPLQQNAVDAVVVGSAFHWFDGEKALTEIARVLKPLGRLGLISMFLMGK